MGYLAIVCAVFAIGHGLAAMVRSSGYERVGSARKNRINEFWSTVFGAAALALGIYAAVA